jgi:hypothetical protein
MCDGLNKYPQLPPALLLLLPSCSDDHVNDFLFILSAAETFAGLNRRRSLLSLAASAQVASFMQLIHRKQLRS